MTFTFDSKNKKHIAAAAGAGIGCGILGFLIGEGIRSLVVGTEQPKQLSAKQQAKYDAEYLQSFADNICTEAAEKQQAKGGENK